MKYSPRFTYTFTPGSSLLDLSSSANTDFHIKGLLSVVNSTTNGIVYAVGASGYGYSSLSGGNVLTLQASMAGMSGTDNLVFFYDDGNAGSTDTVTTGSITAVDSVVAQPSTSGGLVSGTPTAGSYLAAKCGAGDSAVTILVTGFTVATLYFEASYDSTTGIDGNWASLQMLKQGVSSVSLLSNLSVAGMYLGTPTGCSYVRVRALGSIVGTATVRITTSAGTSPVSLQAPLPAGTNMIGGVSLNTSFAGNSVAVPGTPAGYVSVANDPITLINDTFEGSSVSPGTWTTGGTVSPTVSGGGISLAPGTTASATSYISSVATFIPSPSSSLLFTADVITGSTLVTGNQRFWGIGTITTPTTSAPIQTGVIFETDNATGNILASVYSAGTRTQTITAFAFPVGTTPVKYQIYYSEASIYMVAFGSTVATYSSIYLPTVSWNIVAGSVNAGSTLGTAATLTISSLAVADYAQNALQLADGTTPTRRASIRPTGHLDVDIDPTSIIYDSFDALDTTTTWTTGGTAVPTISGGALTLAPSTTASATSYLTSKAAFYPGASSFLGFAAVVTIAAAAQTNNQRFWGLGIVSSPSISVPVTNGVVFEIDNATGNLFCSVYSNSSRTQTTTVTRPTDGGNHRYAIYYKVSKVIYEIDGLQVASLNYPNPATGKLFIVIGSINSSSAPGSAPTLNTTALSLADTGRNATQVADSTYPWQKATVKPASTAAAATDTALVVGLSPNSPLPLATLTKGTQGSTGITTQDLKDSGRNVTAYQMVLPVLLTATDTLQSLTGYKSGAAVTAATAPAVVTTGKTYRITSVTVTYIETATIGLVRATLRANTGGAVVVASPAVASWTVGGTAATAGVASQMAIDIPDGLEFAAGTGIGVTMAGVSATGALAATGYGQISIIGYEY